MKSLIALIATALTLNATSASAALYQISLSRTDASTESRDEAGRILPQTLYIDTTTLEVHLPIPNACPEGVPCRELVRYATFQISTLQIHEGQLIRVFATSKNSEIEISTYRDLSTRVVMRDNNNATEAAFMGSAAESVPE
jgi:hypothetical protein